MSDSFHAGLPFLQNYPPSLAFTGLPTPSSFPPPSKLLWRRERDSSVRPESMALVEGVVDSPACDSSMMARVEGVIRSSSSSSSSPKDGRQKTSDDTTEELSEARGSPFIARNDGLLAACQKVYFRRLPNHPFSAKSTH
ncbi:hypothetical protein CEXT_109441 [Caerostris extrusa]|uniref:Uncharacterized protein n=1 Tax=Caerostris extrusa TaxID=172846 RepID=A0AAV4WQA4_CAEEX|nr:hypothetical protein CEXT_109441 [Caerostris extrusa]